jgi:hypothetical protein
MRMPSCSPPQVPVRSLAPDHDPARGAPRALAPADRVLTVPAAGRCQLSRLAPTLPKHAGDSVERSAPITLEPDGAR